MVIKTDENGYVIACSTGSGHIEGQKYTGEIPEGFFECAGAYKLVDGQLVLDEIKKAEFESHS